MLAIYITSRGSSEEKLKWAFSVYDIDGNGTIESEEMKRFGFRLDVFYNILIYIIHFPRVVNAVCKVLGHASSDTVNSDLIFAEMDTNLDGLIDQKEFIAACKGNKSLMEKLGCPDVKLHLI